MDREEKLRAAKEKLKKFQKKRHGGVGENDITETSSPRSTPKNIESNEDIISQAQNSNEFAPSTTEDQHSMTSSSLSEQIEQVLATSTTRRISDVASDDLELSKIRIGQLEREKSEMASFNLQLKDRISKLEIELANAVRFLANFTFNTLNMCFCFVKERRSYAFKRRF